MTNARLSNRAKLTRRAFVFNYALTLFGVAFLIVSAFSSLNDAQDSNPTSSGSGARRILVASDVSTVERGEAPDGRTKIFEPRSSPLHMNATTKSTSRNLNAGERVVSRQTRATTLKQHVTTTASVTGAEEVKEVPTTTSSSTTIAPALSAANDDLDDDVVGKVLKDKKRKKKKKKPVEKPLPSEDEEDEEEEEREKERERTRRRKKLKHHKNNATTTTPVSVSGNLTHPDKVVVVQKPNVTTSNISLISPISPVQAVAKLVPQNSTAIQHINNTIKSTPLNVTYNSTIAPNQTLLSNLNLNNNHNITKETVSNRIATIDGQSMVECHVKEQTDASKEFVILCSMHNKTNHANNQTVNLNSNSTTNLKPVSTVQSNITLPSFRNFSEVGVVNRTNVTTNYTSTSTLTTPVSVVANSTSQTKINSTQAPIQPGERDHKEENKNDIADHLNEQSDSLRHFIIACSVAVVVATSLAVALIVLLCK